MTTRFPGWVLTIALTFGCCVAACSDSGDEEACTAYCAGTGGVQAGTGGTTGNGGVGGTLQDAGPAVVLDSCKPAGPAPEELGASRTVLVSGSRVLATVASTRQGVVVADPADGVFRLASDDVTLERIVAAHVTDFLAADLNMYWVESDTALNRRSIFRASLIDTDATPAPVATDLTQQVVHMTYDQTNLYFADSAGKALWSIPIAGGAPQMLAGGIDVQALRLRAGFLYYTDADSAQVYRRSLMDGTFEQLSSGSNPLLHGVDADTTHAYWGSDREVFGARFGEPENVIALGQGGPGPGSPGHIERVVLVDERLYWADDLGNLGWSAIDGESCGLVVRGVAGGITGWDVDETSAYLTTPITGGSELWRIAL